MEAVIADVMTQAQGVLLNLTGQQIDGPVALALVVVALNSIVLLAYAALGGSGKVALDPKKRARPLPRLRV